MKMFTAPRPEVWAPCDRPVKKFKVIEEETNPPNSPIKGYEQPVYSHNWIGIGNYCKKTNRVVFHPVPVTPTKHCDGRRVVIN